MNVIAMLKQLAVCILVFCLFFVLCSCGSKHARMELPGYGALENMQYTIQAGAFSSIGNAVQLMLTLENENLQAYYFLDDRDKLYKVRFGNFSTFKQAEKHARNLKSSGLLDDYFIVAPESYAAGRVPGKGTGHLRNELVRTAKSFIGIPYQWGGSSIHSGFDCSGLTMVVYRQNGLNLPRVAAEQYRYGRAVTLSAIQEGDLVFFDTMKRGRVTHVGVYIGNGRFIHAPSSGRRVTTESLSRQYFRSSFVGARTYI